MGTYATKEDQELAGLDTKLYKRLSDQGWSDARIHKAAHLLARVKKGELTEEEAAAMFHGRPLQENEVLVDRAWLSLDLGGVRVPRASVDVRAEMDAFEQAAADLESDS